MKTVINISKSFIGIILFYVVQISLSIIFYSTLKQDNNLVNNLIYLFIEVFLMITLFIFYKDKIKKDFKDFDNNYKQYLKIGIKAYLIGLFIMIISNLIINQFITNSIAHNEQLDRIILFKYPLYSTLAIIITGPINEEIVFRLGFKKYISNKIVYYFLASFIFAFVHTINGITSPLELLYLIPYGSLSIAFTYILDKTDNIFSNIIIHSINNTISVLLILSVSLIGV